VTGARKGKAKARVIEMRATRWSCDAGEGRLCKLPRQLGAPGGDRILTSITGQQEYRSKNTVHRRGSYVGQLCTSSF
jgi:hypothetical protein